MNFYQVMRIMKLCMLLICCCLIQVSAKTYGQRISMVKSNASIPEVLLEARKQSGYDFFYDANIFAGTSKVTVKLASATLEEALNACFSHLPYRYSIKNNIVVIHKVADTKSAAKTSKQQMGKIIGKIVDSRGKGIYRVSIKLQENGYSTRTAADGSFSMDVPIGTYTIMVSHVSYQTQKVVDVLVRAGEMVRMDLAMRETSSKIKEVVVTTTFKKATISGLLAARKNAASVTDGISAEEIARTPDNDMGQVLKRVTGLTTVNNRSVVVRGMSDRYNQAQIDGVNLPSTSIFKRDFAFDVIPTELVSSVVVNKTATPDVSSEFAGGQISVNTLDIPDRNFTSISLGTGGNSQSLGKDFYRLGERKTNEYLGFYDKSAEIPAGITPWYIHMEARQKEVIPRGKQTDPSIKDKFLIIHTDPRTYGDLDAIEQSKRFTVEPLRRNRYIGSPNQNFRFSLGRVFDLPEDIRLGFVASANFRNEQNLRQSNNVRGATFIHYSPDGKVSGRWMDSDKFGYNGPGVTYRFNSSSGLIGNIGIQGPKFKLAIKNVYSRTYADDFSEYYRMNYSDAVESDDLHPAREQYQLPESLSILQHQINGDYHFPWRIKLEGMFTVNNSKMRILDERRLRYNPTLEHEGKMRYQTPAVYTTSQTGSGELGREGRLWSLADGVDYNWATALSKSFDFGDKYQNIIKVGYQGWDKRKSYDQERVMFMMRSYVKGNEASTVPFLSYHDIFADHANVGDQDNQVYYFPSYTNGNMFEGRMKNHSLYAMMDQRLWRFLRLVYGVRVEYYDLKNQQDAAFARRSEFNPTVIDNPLYRHQKGVFDKDVRWMPSVNATFNLTHNINFRSSFSRTAIRPDFRETAMVGGNIPELNANVYGEHVFTTGVENTDVRLEWYPSAEELLSITAYYKYLDAPVELMRSRSENSKTYYYNNMLSAYNKGLELEFRKNMGFLGKSNWLKNLYLFGNGTLLRSRVEVLDIYKTTRVEEEVVRTKERLPGQDRPLIGQSPWLLNLGIAYWGENYGITGSFNHRGHRTSLTHVQMNLVEFENAPRQLDLQVYARFMKKKMEVKFNAANLLNDWAVFYRNEKYKSPGEMEEAIKLDPKNAERPSVGDLRYNYDDGDAILYRFRDGRRFGLNISYNF